MTTVTHCYFNLPDNTIRFKFAGKPDAVELKVMRENRVRWWPGSNWNVVTWSVIAEDMLKQLFGIEDIPVDFVEDDPNARQDRFARYEKSARADADRMVARLEDLTNGADLDVPIVIGHHRADRANRQARKVKQAQQAAAHEEGRANYWQRRAERVLAHAEYKAQPDVIKRRLKKYETERRGCDRARSDHKQRALYWIMWDRYGAANNTVLVAHKDEIFPLLKTFNETGDYTQVTTVQPSDDGSINSSMWESQQEFFAHCQDVEEIVDRQSDHLDMLINYQKGLLEQAGGHALDHADPKPDDWIQARGWGWLRVVKVLKATILCYDPRMTWTPSRQRKIKKELVMRIGTQADADAANLSHTEQVIAQRQQVQEPTREQQLRAAAKQEIKVVQADELFETSYAMAERMVEYAELEDEDAVAEPSAGTGVIVRAIQKRAEQLMGLRIEAIEINQTLADALDCDQVYCMDFVEFAQAEHYGMFNAVIMNPPFSHQLEHVQRAYNLLATGGRLIAVMSESPFFAQGKHNDDWRAWFKARGGEILEDLPCGTFAGSGTNVKTRLIRMVKA
jgi:phospholipid N-methyltransferase